MPDLLFVRGSNTSHELGNIASCLLLASWFAEWNKYARWWELVELIRKFCLTSVRPTPAPRALNSQCDDPSGCGRNTALLTVGIVQVIIFVKPGTTAQLASAFMISVFFFVLHVNTGVNFPPSSFAAGL